MDTRQLKTLIAIADHETFARAADAVHITPSAVSQQVIALETKLGLPIFNRETRPPTFNLRGLQILEMARRVLHIVEETKLILDEDRVAGTLNIGSVRSSTIGLLPPVVVALREKYPGLKINLRVGLSNALIADVLADRLNLGIVAEHVGMPRLLKWSPFIREPLVVIAPPDTPGNTAREILSTTPYVRFSSSVPLANLIDTELAKMNVVTEDIAEIDTVSTIVECVAAGLGAGIVPDIALRSAPAPVKAVPFGEPQIFRQIGIVHATNSPRAAFFSEVHRGLAEMAGRYGIYPSESDQADN